MSRGKIHAFYGNGKGKTSAALGQALREAREGQSISVIQFLKGKLKDEFKLIKRLEPEVNVFTFDRSEESYCDLSFEEREEEKQNILNGFNYAKKVIETGETDIIILDELFGLVDLGIISEDDVKEILELEGDYEKMYITGDNLAEGLIPQIDIICKIVLEKDENE